MLRAYSGFIFDMDGTIYRGSSIIPGADEVYNRLIELGKHILFVTNKTTGSVTEYSEFLNDNGIRVLPEQIISSASVIRKFIIENHEGEKFFAIGERTFINELNNHVVTYSENSNEIDIVIVTLDRTLTFEKIEIAAKALENGARFFAANIDDTCPVNDGEITDAGAVIAVLEKRTGRKLEDHFGKPSKHMFNALKEKLSYPADKYLLVGDRMQTDIKMGNDFGIDTALVSTGVKNLSFNNNVKPNYEFSSVKDILKNYFD